MRCILATISDRRRLGAEWPQTLPQLVETVAAAGVALVQIREPDLEAAALARLVRDCLEAVSGTSTRVLVNDRVDVALAAGAHGVHLRGDSVSAAVRAISSRPFLIGRSVHAVDEALKVTADGELDYLIFGPVFETASKPGRTPAGVAALRTVSMLTRVPVLAVGGISPDRLPLIAAAGAAGAAAIGMFASTPAVDLLSVVAKSALVFDTQGGRSLT